MRQRILRHIKLVAKARACPIKAKLERFDTHKKKVYPDFPLKIVEDDRMTIKNVDIDRIDWFTTFGMDKVLLATQPFILLHMFRCVQ